MAKPPEPHHLAWLSAHPDRTLQWLRDRLRDGFDVHHIDGDHSNNVPTNLVLIEAVDHLRLHGVHLKNGLAGWRKRVAANQIKKVPLEVQAAPVELDRGLVLAYVSRAGRS